MSLPFDVYVTWTFGYCLLKPAITLSKAFCADADQMPQNLTLPETLVFADVDELFDPPPPPPPQPAATARIAASSAAIVVRRVARALPALGLPLTLLLLSPLLFRRRFLRSSPRRRSGARGCRPPLRPASPPGPWRVPRSARRATHPRPSARGRRSPRERLRPLPAR